MFKLVHKILNLIQSQIQQKILVDEIKDDILFQKIKAIQYKLLKCDKVFLVQMLLSLRLQDKNDIHECYEKLILHNKQEFLKN